MSILDGLRPSLARERSGRMAFTQHLIDRTIIVGSDAEAYENLFQAALLLGGDFDILCVQSSGYTPVSLNIVVTSDGAITTSMLRLGVDGDGHDACQGISGSSLKRGMNGNMRAGLVSWSIGNARSNINRVYARLSHTTSYQFREDEDDEDPNECCVVFDGNNLPIFSLRGKPVLPEVLSRPIASITILSVTTIAVCGCCGRGNRRPSTAAAISVSDV